MQASDFLGREDAGTSGEHSLVQLFLHLGQDTD